MCKISLSTGNEKAWAKSNTWKIYACSNDRSAILPAAPLNLFNAIAACVLMLRICSPVIKKIEDENLILNIISASIITFSIASLSLSRSVIIPFFIPLLGVVAALIILFLYLMYLPAQ